MSVVGDAITALREALKIQDEVRKHGDDLKTIAHELRDLDRRVTRVEAKWEAAVELSGRGLRSARRLEEK